MNLRRSIYKRWQSVASTHPASFNNVFLQVGSSCHQHVNSLQRWAGEKYLLVKMNERRVQRNVFKQCGENLPSSDLSRIPGYCQENKKKKSKNQTEWDNEGSKMTFRTILLPLVDLQLSATSLSLRLIQDLLKSKNCNRNVSRKTCGEGPSAMMSVYPHVHPKHSLFNGCWRSDHLFIHHICQLLLEHILPFGTQFLNTKNLAKSAEQLEMRTFSQIGVQVCYRLVSYFSGEEFFWVRRSRTYLLQAK